MPTYDYLCAACGPMEIFQSMKDDALRACPECGGKRFQRQISGGAGVIFKGDGFYETDYNRSSSYQSQAKADCGSGCACHGDGGAKAEAKPAEKTASKASD